MVFSPRNMIQLMLIKEEMKQQGQLKCKFKMMKPSMIYENETIIFKISSPLNIDASQNISTWSICEVTKGEIKIFMLCFNKPGFLSSDAELYIQYIGCKH